MRFISIFGMITLLGIAWAISVDRKSIRIRPVIWGLALQFLFAVIILQENALSWIGMAVLGLMLVIYSFQADLRDNPRMLVAAGILTVISLAVAFVLTYLGNWINLGWVAVILIAAMFVNGNRRWRPELSRYFGAGLVITLISWAISTGSYGTTLFRMFSVKIAAFLDLSFYGARFLFANLVDSQYWFTPPDSSWPGFGFQFAFKVLPTIIFFGGFMAVLYHLGIMQKVINAMSRFMRWTIGTSGAETLAVSANIFVGQTEAPLLIKPFLKDMTTSELLTIMVGGFATIAGGVLAGYIAMGVDAGHLVAASVMSAPAALAVAKIIYPEKDHSVTAGDMDIPYARDTGNVIEAASNGILDGLKLAVNVGAMLLGFIALIAVADVILNGLDRLIDGKILGGTLVQYGSTSGISPITSEFSGIFPGSLKTLFGTVLRPLAFLMGVSWEYADEVGNLLGIKISLNEFVAYGTLGGYIHAEALDERATVIATYALCGFANFSSIGIQLGGIGAFIPERRGELASIALRAMTGGAIASFLTATVAGIMLM